MQRTLVATLTLALCSTPALAAVPAPISAGDLAVNGSTIHYQTFGRGPAVVLLHDELLDSAAWDDQIEALAQGHLVVRYDRRGFGRSAQPTEAYRDEDDLEALLDHLEIPRAVLVGSSAGGAIAVNFTLEHPTRVSALVLVGTLVDGLGISSHFARRNLANSSPDTDTKIGHWIGDPFVVASENSAARARFEQLLRAHPNDLDSLKYAFQRQYEAEHDPPPLAVRRLSEIRVPSLILTGAADIPDVQAHAGALQAGIAGARRMVVPGCGHLLYLEQPAVFNRVLLDFLSLLSLDLDGTAGFERGFVDVGNTFLYYEALGHGHPLVLIHGGLLDHRMWDDQFQALADHFRVIRYDVQGHGLSRNVASKYWNYRDLATLLDHLGIARTHLLGLSMGGRIAADFAIAHPDRVSALVLASTGLSGWKFDGKDLVENRKGLSTAWRAGDFEQAVEYFQRSWTDGHRTPDEIAPGVRQRIRAMALDNIQPGSRAGESWELDPPSVGRLAEIQAPTLIIVGQLDNTDIHEISDQLARQVAGARKIELTDVAHVLNMEKPEEFNRLVTEFLEGVSGSPAGAGDDGRTAAD